MKKIFCAFLTIVFLLTFGGAAWAADGAALSRAIANAARYMLETVKNPTFDSVGGDWAVVALARGAATVPDEWYETYRKNVEEYVRSREGVLHENKYTEYARAVLGLTAAGFDPQNIAGYDLTKPLENFEKTVWQGLNGPIWALLALDSLDYANEQRDKYVAEILRRQLDNGGWNLTGGVSAATKNGAAAPDVTGMALQALAPYRERAEVGAAIDRALSYLSNPQGPQSDTDGAQTGASLAPEYAAQILIALCSLGISLDDPRFVRNGRTPLDEILSRQSADGGFSRGANGSSNNQMLTEQALLALVAAQRAARGQNSLYRMSDAVRRGAISSPDASGLPGKHADIQPVPITKPDATFADIARHPDKTAIEALAARAIVDGAGGGRFDPDAALTRAQLSKMVVFSLGLPEKPNHPFSDVAPGAWFANPVATAYHYEIVRGVGDGRFNPNGSVSRQDAAVMIARAAGLAGLDTKRSDTEIQNTLASFDDYRTVAPYARSALALCYAMGFLDDSALTIEPTKAATRAEIARMLYVLLKQANLCNVH